MGHVGDTAFLSVQKTHITMSLGWYGFFARCNSLSCPPGQLAPRGARYPGVSCPPSWAACPPPQKTWQTQFKMIFIFFFITNLYHTIIRTVVMYVFHYFTFYGRRLGLRYCSLSIFLPNSEVLAVTVQKDILSLLIEFPIEQVIKEFPVSDITYLSSNRKGQGLRYPGLGSLPPTPNNLANSNLKSYLIILNLKF